MKSEINKIKTIFIGTPDFSVPSLRALINDKNFNVIAAIAQPDKKVGRKQIVTPPPVKVEALKYNIPVFQPEKISDLKPEIKNLRPDIIVVAAYAQIIPKSILDIPRYGCVNVHASLLPKYRGASCIQAAIINGDKETGITIMKMDEGLDTGPIIFQKNINIENFDTGGSLFNKLSALGAEILTPALLKFVSGEIKHIPQNNSKASYAGLLKKNDGKINWSKNAEQLEKFIRAMNPWPSAFAQIKSQKSKIKSYLLIFKIITVEHEPIKINKYQIGEVFLNDEKLAVQCGRDSLIIEKLQMEGKKVMESKEFLRGQKDFIGTILL